MAYVEQAIANASSLEMTDSGGVGVDPTTIFVGGLPRDCPQEVLVEHFSVWGTIKKAEVKIGVTGAPRGFGFVEFDDAVSVNAVMEDADAHTIGDKPIDIKPYQKGMTKGSGPPPGSGGGGKGGGGKGMAKGMDKGYGKSWDKGYGSGKSMEYMDADAIFQMGLQKGKGLAGSGGWDKGGWAKGGKDKGGWDKGGWDKGGKERGGKDKGDKNGKDSRFGKPTAPADAPLESDKIFVGGLPKNTQSDMLGEYFSQFGDVVGVEVKTDPQTQMTRGFGFVTFSDTETVDRIIAANGSLMIGEKVIDVKRAAQQKDDEKMKIQTRLEKGSKGDWKGGGKGKDRDPNDWTGGKGMAAAWAAGLRPPAAGTVAAPAWGGGGAGKGSNGWTSNPNWTAKPPMPNGPEESAKIFVGGLPKDAEEQHLLEYFSMYGGVSSVEVKRHIDSQRTRGFGFVQFDDPDVVEAVIADFATHSLGGQWIEVKRASSRDGTENMPRGPPSGTLVPGGGKKGGGKSWNGPYW